MILDTAGTVLPRGLSFLEPGWWLLHAMAILFTYLFGYRKGRGDEQRLQRARDMEGRRTPKP
ncbi:MAG: hypothetical protein ACHQ52_02870 [Candidatus Eisenbacteria bacterium]